MAIHDWQRLVKTHLASARRPLIVVLGPTASGKTSFTLKLCEWIQTQGGPWRGAEVVNADSRQLYRHLDIGTAKIAKADMRGIPHHLIDVLDPRDRVSIGWYQEHAVAAIGDILGRGNVPVLAGGSMLYISSVVDGLLPLPPVNSALRMRLGEEYESDGGIALHRRLADVDPASAEAVDRRNKVYLVRAMELCESAGLPASRQKTAAAPAYDVLMLGMDRPRTELHRRINERTRQLFAAGWAEEVAAVLRMGYIASDPGMISHGYREIAGQMSDGGCGISEKSAEELASVIAAKTRQYAKRQMTWWRNDPRIQWIREGI